MFLYVALDQSQSTLQRPQSSETSFVTDMENDCNVNIGNMFRIISLLVLPCLLSPANGRIHRLKLEDDSRKQITLSTFGFLKFGTLAVNISSFSMELHGKVPDATKANRTLFGFTLDKSKSPGLSSYMEGMQEICILNNPNIKTENMESVFFSFDFKTKKLNINRIGEDLEHLMVSRDPYKDFLIKHDLNHVNRRAAGTQEFNARLSDDYLVGRRRKVREAVSASPTPKRQQVDLTVKEGGATASEGGASDKTKTPEMKATSAAAPSSTGRPVGQSPNTSQSEVGEAGGPVDEAPSSDGAHSQGVAVAENVDAVDVSRNEDGSYKSYFLVHIQKPEEEGLYNLFFHNCLSYTQDSDAVIDITMEIIEDNNGNFLSAGEMPVPALYFTFSVLFFIAGVAWLSVLRRSEEEVYKIHYLMLVVVFVKSLACLFHGVNMYFIQISGLHEDAWAILWYIVYLTRGALMFVTVLLIGAGWAFIKHVLTDKEKKLFVVVISLQILDRVAEVIVEESEEGNQSYMTWKEIFILVDLLCCGAILFPVVWSISHLQEASRTDGKAAINLQKLKLFRHFYILVVCYIYFTRIIVYLMKITLPFKLEWLTDLFTELAMMVFFVVTGAKFRPATDNPYLQVPLDSDDEEEIEMEEVLTKTGSTEAVVRVNQKTEGATNQIKQRESSHEYD